ncbi:hypothetical protein HYY74_01075 [Candidatus Woesearchaeota archaeon]|nr:hypothetical protein [Candidatus Woesearchaeota archaeon]
MPLGKKEAVIVDILKELLNRTNRISEFDLTQKLCYDYNLSSEREAKHVIKLLRGSGFIEWEGEPEGQMISINPNGIKFLMDYEFKQTQTMILNKQTDILNTTKIIYWILAIATVFMAIATIIIAFKP